MISIILFIVFLPLIILWWIMKGVAMLLVLLVGLAVGAADQKPPTPRPPPQAIMAPAPKAAVPPVTRKPSPCPDWLWAQLCG
jgi:hypothetical protein